MRFLIICLFILYSGANCLFSQTIKGKIIDRQTKAPVSKVSVYLDGTSTYALSDDDGNFELSVEKIINTNLVISHVAYNQLIIPNPFQKDYYTLYLDKKTNVLKEVVIEGDPFTRKQKLKAFKNQFLGDDKYGRNCEILNEDDIELYYKPSKKILTATAEKPIIITNKYLGYRVEFFLRNFECEYLIANTINDEDAKQAYFDGMSLFADLKRGEKKFEKRRKEVFEETPVHFFKSFINYKLKEDKYKIFNVKKGLVIKNDVGVEINPQLYFTVEGSSSGKKICVREGTDINKQFSSKKESYGIVDILQDKKRRSRIVFLSDCIFVDSYGNIDDPVKIMFSGHFAKYRIGRMLPIDYEP